MQRFMLLDVALLELKPICDEAIPCLSFACLFVPHGGHMHLRDQKAHKQLQCKHGPLAGFKWLVMIDVLQCEVLSEAVLISSGRAI